jgi:hypothetical protein
LIDWLTNVQALAAPTSDNDVARSTSSIKWEADMIFHGPVIAGGPNVNISGKYDVSIELL